VSSWNIAFDTRDTNVRLHLSSCQTYISRDVVFDENFFPFNSSILSPISTSPQLDSPIFL